MNTSGRRTSYIPRNKRRILCVFPKYSNSFGTFHHAYGLMKGVKAFMPPQGILVIANYMPEQWEVRFVDENIREARTEDYEWADAVMVSGMHIQRPRINRINDLAHGHGKLTVIGGPSVSGCPEYYPAFDLMHVGELGDATDQIIEYIDANIERPASQIRFDTRERRPLNDFPVPAYDLVKMNQYFLASIQFSSGCPYHCEFCDIPALYGHNPRLKDPQRVVDELDAIVSAGAVAAVYFVDDNFVGNRKATMELMPHLIEWQKRNSYPVEFACEATLNIAQSPKLLEMMNEAFFCTVFCGIESPDEEALTAMAKKQNLSIGIMDAIRTLNEHGMEVVSGIILGLDTDTPQTARKVLDFIRASNIPMLTINLLHALPRTALWDRLQKADRIVFDDTLESNVKFLLPYDDVVNAWKFVISHAYEPEFLYQRFAYNREHTYCNRKKIPSKGRATPAKMLQGFATLGKILWQVGVRSDYRKTFWKMAKPALKAGDIEYVIHVGLVSHHLIKFTRECVSGQEAASFYAQHVSQPEEQTLVRLVG